MEDIYQDKPTLLQRAYAKSCDVVNNSLEYFASLSIGQTCLQQTDRLLWSVEKCAEWSVPTAPVPKHSNSNGTFGKPAPLVRPLPWLLFLPMLLFLRIVRFSLNIGAMLMGMETVKPSQIVRFIQVRRRRIRALKFMGLRRITQRKVEDAQKLTWRETFYNIMSRAMCFRVTNTDMYEQITIKKENADEADVASTSKHLIMNANIAGNSCLICNGHQTNLEFRFAMKLTMHPRSEQQCNCLAITSGENLEQSSKPKKKSISGQNLKRKYIEILKNNYMDWDDVENDEELVERITQLAEDESEDPDFVPAEEDSATEEDSMSDAEDDASISSNSSPKPELLRPPSHGSLTNETIEEENEENSDSDSTTVSANSGDESSQHITSTCETPKKEEKIDDQKSEDSKNYLTATNSDAAVTEDEFCSPLNSMSASPEPKTDNELPKYNNQNNTQETTNSNIDDKKITETFLNSEKEQVANALNNNNQISSPLPANNKQPIVSHESVPVQNTKSNSNSNSSFSPRGHGKKHKHRRRLSNLLRRKKK